MVFRLPYIPTFNIFHTPLIVYVQGFKMNEQQQHEREASGYDLIVTEFQVQYL